LIFNIAPQPFLVYNSNSFATHKEFDGRELFSNKMENKQSIKRKQPQAKQNKYVNEKGGLEIQYTVTNSDLIKLDKMHR